MKMRAMKHFKKLLKISKTITVQLFMVSRKKDNALIKIVDSKSQANAMILKAKAAKKASLYVSGSYRQKYSREAAMHYESQMRN